MNSQDPRYINEKRNKGKEHYSGPDRHGTQLSGPPAAKEWPTIG